MTNITHATDETFAALVLHRDVPIVVDFYAPWCGPCRMIGPELERLASRHAGRIEVVKVDVDANPVLARSYDIMSVPTVALFRPGEQPLAINGFRRLEQIEEAFGLHDLAA